MNFGAVLVVTLVGYVALRVVVIPLYVRREDRLAREREAQRYGRS